MACIEYVNMGDIQFSVPYATRSKVATAQCLQGDDSSIDDT